jgi:hypothetical protein
MSFFQIPIDEWWDLGVYYRGCLICCAVLAGLLTISAVFIAKHNNRFSNIKYYVFVVPLAIWVIYFCNTAKEAFAVTSLDSENNIYAEVVYNSCFDIDLEQTIQLAIDKRQSGNVRFYASCRVADILATNGTLKVGVFERIADTPAFRTGFGGTNDLTCGFFTPNYAEGPFTVREIIAKRLRQKEKK